MIPAQHPVPTSGALPSTAQAQEVEARRILERAIEENTDTLLRWVERLLRRMNVFERSRGRSPGDIAGDVLGDACLAVLRNASRFDTTRDPVPWILGYAVNVAKRQRDEVFKANRAAADRTEVSATDIAGEEQSGEEALEEHAAALELSLGMLAGRRSSALETRQALASLLGPLSEDERNIVALSVFEGYDSPRLAARLGTSAPAARKRLQRALDRLRAHIRSHPEQFAWIEDLPSRLEQRAPEPEANAAQTSRETRETHAIAPSHSSRQDEQDEQDEAKSACHSAGPSRQQPEHDSSQAPRGSVADSADALAATPTRSSSMKSLSPCATALSTTAPSATARRGEPSP